MGLLSALETLNGLKRKGIIKDYTIGDGYAVNYYLEPSYTYDLDIFVLLDSDDDYHALYRYFREAGNKIENIYIMIGDLPVQFLPSFISPLFAEAIKKARRITVGRLPSKVVRVEHLIALLLAAFRPKGKINIISLLELAGRKVLDEILRRFENEETPLYQRLERVLENL